MKIVLDASVIVAAFAAHGLCEAVFELCLDSHQLLISTDLMEEVRTALRAKIKLPGATIDGITELIRENATMVVPEAVPADSCRDKNDLHILGLAAAGKADYLITGDNDLLVLKKFRACRILTPRQFSDRIHARQ